MKRHQLNITALLSAVLLILINSPVQAQIPPFCNGPPNMAVETWIFPFTIKMTTDGGTIVGGYTDSRNGDVSPQPNRINLGCKLINADRLNGKNHSGDRL